MPRCPGLKLSEEVFPARLVQLSHDVGMLCGEPILKLVECFD